MLTKIEEKYQLELEKIRVEEEEKIETIPAAVRFSAGYGSSRDLVRWAVWFPVRRALTAVPRIWAVKAGDKLGWARWHLSRQRRLITAGEISWLLGWPVDDPRTGAAVREAMALAGTNLIESFFGLDTPQRSAEVFSFTGTEHLDEALRAGRGAILLLCHFGANQLCMAALGTKAIPSIRSAAAEDRHWLVNIEPSQIERRVFEARLALERQLPARFLDIEKSMRPVFDCLSRNEILIMAFDGRAGSQWIRIPLFGREMNISTGPFTLARRAKAPILPLFMLRQPGGRHMVALHPPLPMGEGQDRDAAIRTPAVAFAKLMERYILERPGHYAGLLAEARIRADKDEVPLFVEPSRLEPYPALAACGDGLAGQLTPKEAVSKLTSGFRGT